MSLFTVTRRRGWLLPAPPYTIPAARPYNVPQPISTPTYDGSGSTVHPGVVDARTFGARSWNGYRFWMAHTPFPNGNAALENPSILASHDGITWETPPGVTNPLHPPPAENWNADTDLTYNPATGEMNIVFISYQDGQYWPLLMRSTNGADWSPAVRLSEWVQPADTMVSPTLTRLTDGTWAMFGIGSPSRTLRRWTAPAPAGPWSAATTCTGMPSTIWHIHVMRHGARLLSIVDDGMEIGLDGNPQGIYAATSTDDGLTWTRNPDKLIELSPSGWDSFDLYRATMQPHEDGTHMRVWYGGRSNGGQWRIGYTHIPITEWPTP